MTISLRLSNEEADSAAYTLDEVEKALELQ